jgi:Trp operon repressor
MNQVRELLERQLNIFDIAQKMGVSIDIVKLAANTIKGTIR